MRQPERRQRRLDLIERDVRTVALRVVEIEIHGGDFVSGVLRLPPRSPHVRLGRIVFGRPSALHEERG